MLPLNGTGQGEKDPGLLLALARFGQNPASSSATPGPGRSAADRAMGPASLREARRGMRLAEELGLPLLTVIDTAGAALSKEAEEGGLAGEIARSLHDLIGLQRTHACPCCSARVPAAARWPCCPADRTIAAQHAWLSPLPPEGASAIVHRSTDFAPAMSEAQGVNVASLYANGLVEHIVDERPDAAARGAGVLPAPRAGHRIRTRHALLGPHDRAAAQTAAASTGTLAVLLPATALSRQWSSAEGLNKSRPEAKCLWPAPRVGPVGIEPTTHGLKVRCSTN